MYQVYLRSVAVALLLFDAVALAAPPTIRTPGTADNKTTTCTPGAPGSTADGDLQLMFCETQNGETITATDWTALDSQDNASLSKLSVLYRQYLASRSTNYTTNDPGDHCICRVISLAAGTWNGTVPEATPAKERGSTGTRSIPGGTTGTADCAVFIAATQSQDYASTTNYSFTDNADLASDTEQMDNHTTSGNGGGFCVATGTKAVAGSYTTTAISITNSDGGGEMSFHVCYTPSGRRRAMVIE